MSPWTNRYSSRSAEREPAAVRISLRTNERRRGGPVLGDPRHCGEGGDGEALAEDRRVVHERALVREEAVEARCDERREGLRHGQIGQVAGGHGAAVAQGEPALGEKHAHGLHRVERDAVGARHDRLRGGLREARREPRQELTHRRVRQRLECDRGEVALGMPVGAALEQVRPGERQHVDRARPAPLEQVVDEVDQPGIGVVEILEDQGDRARVGQTLEECAPRAEQLGRGGRRRADAEQCEERTLDPSSLGLVRDLLAHGRCHRGTHRGLVIGLAKAAAAADHLAQGAEAGPFAVGGRATHVPPHPLGDAVHVLAELPGQAALTDAGRSHDRDEPGPALASRRVEQLLEQVQLLVASDERRLQRLGAVASATLGNDPQGRHAGTGTVLPLSAWSPTASNAIALEAARIVASPTSTVPGAAAACSREAMLTGSPATIPWPRAPSVTAASPVRTPARAAMPGPRRPTAPTRSRAARTARSASSSCADGAPHTAITASPMNFSMLPA